MKGEYRRLIHSHSQFVNSLSEHRIPFRDLRALLKSSDCAARLYSDTDTKFWHRDFVLKYVVIGGKKDFQVESGLFRDLFWSRSGLLSLFAPTRGLTPPEHKEMKAAQTQGLQCSRCTLYLKQWGSSHGEERGPEAPAAIFLVRISAKILSISENFCQISV